MYGLQDTISELTEIFLNRRLPNHQTFGAVKRRLRETDQFIPSTADYGRQRTTRTPEIEEEILERVSEDPKLNTRRLGIEMGVKNIRIATPVKAIKGFESAGIFPIYIDHFTLEHFAAVEGFIKDREKEKSQKDAENQGIEEQNIEK
ncbi:hypothetical protein FQA39_LY09453 [Lamprigera yunnana]|nr:hypothetical protein FQA39_LY09453 [Lamprigera yunnana]